MPDFLLQNGTVFRGGSGGEYLELVPGERLRYTDKFDDPNLPGEIQVTVELRAVACGTELKVTQAGIPEVIPPEMCYLGWQESLEYLARLVEPEIPNASGRGRAMKYLCLAYESEAPFKAMPRAERDALREETLSYVETLKRSGTLIDTRPLRSATTAVTLTQRGGRLTVTHGPFAETKEQLGGYFLIEAGSLDEAVQIAAGWPGARYGQIEVRPVAELLPEASRY